MDLQGLESMPKDFPWDRDAFEVLACKNRNNELVACAGGAALSIFLRTRKPIYVWKATRRDGEPCVTKLELPRNTIVHVPADYKESLDLDDRKCRASKAVVLQHKCHVAIGFWEQVFGTSPPVTKSLYSSSFEYPIGETVEPNTPFSVMANRCEEGIHFFPEKDDAEKWG